MSALQKWIVPANESLLIRHPMNNVPIPITGCYATWTGAEGIYWRRRLREGSILVYDEKPINETVNEEQTKIKKSKTFDGGK